ncbi:hypothetical protein NVP1076O_63 [Vibrio phage 1.076.O._10N.286.51.B7]|nr:hypothetical protein NVP1076O_63 [Vibrio phage 1.076.O._10N.286.51.B7]
MKLSNETLTLITRIQNLCIEISQTTEHDAFFHYSGQVDSIDVGVCNGGFAVLDDGLSNEIKILSLTSADDENQDTFKQCIVELEGYLVK